MSLPLLTTLVVTLVIENSPGWFCRSIIEGAMVINRSIEGAMNRLTGVQFVLRFALTARSAAAVVEVVVVAHARGAVVVPAARFGRRRYNRDEN